MTYARDGAGTMSGYRTPAGKASDEPAAPPLYASDSALVGDGVRRWRIRFVRKHGTDDVFAVTEYAAARRWWGTPDLSQPMREVGTVFVRGFGTVNWYREDGYPVSDALAPHLAAAVKRQEWAE